MRGCSCAWLLLALGATLPAQARYAATVPPDGVVFGEPFEVVVHVTSRAGVPEPFDEGRLRPLRVESREIVGGAGQATRSATRQYRCRVRCFAVGDVVLPFDPQVTLTVRSALPQPAGELEWPGDGWPLPRNSRASWLFAALFALAGLAGWSWWRWLRRGVASESDTTPVAVWRAQADLLALALPDSGRAAVDGFYQQLKAIVRRHCAVHLALPASVRTSEEIVRLLPRAQQQLAPCFSACDLVLFAAAQPDTAAHQKAREHAIAFVQATEVAS